MSGNCSNENSADCSIKLSFELGGKGKRKKLVEMRGGRGERDELDHLKPASSVFKDSSVGLLRILCFLIVFVIGVVVGLTSSSHVDRYFTSQPDDFYTIRASAVAPTPTTNPSPAPEQNCTPTATTTTFVINYCEKEDCLSMDSFLRPKNLSHGMNDNELFWRASLVPNKPEYPYKRVPKIAFMFLTRGPLPLLPLWEEFFQGQDKEKYSIYVHALPGFELGVANSSVFYNRQIPSQDVKWGTVSLVDAEKRLLGNALLDFSNERFVLLSESCIPIYNFATVYKYLIGSAHSFLDSYDDPSRYGRGRYNRKLKPDIKLRDWRKGSQWFELHRIVAIKIISDTMYYTLFRKYCTPACYPDEHYMPTFVNMFHGSLNANRTITYVDWSQGGPHPASFGAENITKGLIESIRYNGTMCSYNSIETPVCYLFARKFTPAALEPLLNLTSTILDSAKF